VSRSYRCPQCGAMRVHFVLASLPITPGPDDNPASAPAPWLAVSTGCMPIMLDERESLAAWCATCSTAFTTEDRPWDGPSPAVPPTNMTSGVDEAVELVEHWIGDIDDSCASVLALMEIGRARDDLVLELYAAARVAGRALRGLCDADEYELMTRCMARVDRLDEWTRNQLAQHGTLAAVYDENARILASAGCADEALQAWQTAFELSPAADVELRLEIHAALAGALSSAGRHDEALTLAMELLANARVETDPDPVGDAAGVVLRIHENRGEWLHALRWVLHGLKAELRERDFWSATLGTQARITTAMARATAAGDGAAALRLVQDVISWLDDAYDGDAAARRWLEPLTSDNRSQSSLSGRGSDRPRFSRRSD